MSIEKVDVLLVGAGIMSATLATLLHKLDPQLHIMMLEKLADVAHESSDGWNNAGTGHAGYCELNYTPQHSNGSIDIQRALTINANFELTLQFWSTLVQQQALPEPSQFINATPHISLVWGEEVTFLRKRHHKLSQHPLFADMEFSEATQQLAQWMPLVMQQRSTKQPVAATRVAYGTDVDFGAVTRSLIKNLQSQTQFALHTKHSVRGLKQQKDGSWLVDVYQTHTKKIKHIQAKFVFLGAGGAALSLLQKSGIAEGKGYGGFPVSGQWLVCNKPEIVQQHQAKVYGKAALGAPPMSVPHLDTRIIAGKSALLFGPYAGFTTKFLKQGSFLDLIKSVKLGNVKPMLSAGKHNSDLTRYLIGEVFQSHQARVNALKHYYPQAKAQDWHLAKAGQRVQIIKHCGQKGGKLEFGTEIVAAKDGSLAALLGASTSVPAMLEVLQRCFKQRLAQDWQTALKEMLPSYGESLIENADLLRQVRAHNLKILKLDQAR